MKEQLDLLDKNLQQAFKMSENLVALNIKYLYSIGLKNPVELISITPQLFLLSNELVQEKTQGIDVDLINEDPYEILEYIG